MTEKRYFNPENLVSIIGIGLTLILINSAFSEDVRKEIGKRDRWTCQLCGKSYRAGYMVHAAHLPEHHSKDDPKYNSPGAGRILCIDCHQKEHEQGTSLGKQADQRAVQLLKMTNRQHR